MRVMIVDTNVSFLDDIQRIMLIDERTDLEIVPVNDINEVPQCFNETNPDQIVVSIRLIESMDWNFGVPVYTYARNDKEMENLVGSSYPCYGVVKRSTKLLDAIVSGTVIHVEKSVQTTQQTAQQTTQTTQQTVQQTTQQTTQNTQESNDAYLPAVTPSVTPLGTGFTDQSTGIYYPLYQMTYMDNGVPMTAVVYYFNNQPYFYGQPQVVQKTPQPKEPEVTIDQYAEEGFKAAAEEHIPQSTKSTLAAYYANVALHEGATTVLRDGNDDTILRSAVKKNVEEQRQKEEEVVNKKADEEFELSFNRRTGKAKCITVYSAKGGVGKTTVACELATFLALTAHHRGRYRVCIADFNIDFGDVLNTLSFDQKGANMTTWAEDIRSKLNQGMDIDEIQYSQSRIEVWLQKNEKDGLYALLAPTNNLDSMKIKDKELKVMLKNLIENGGFDFVICDTGNNTRDSSFIALEYSDIVLMVLTQSVNTANCNNSFLQTAERVKFDMDKIKLVINRVLPAKVTGIAAEELESAFINPKTNRPYPFECVAKIKEDSKIINANNLGQPLVYDANHSLTRSIKDIVSHISEEQYVLEAPKKKGVFQKLFKKD